ncbi:MAG: DNA alkylation repair protein [Ignavibacteria bacterium]|nr:DNA alkylation repair protein [Ignavibacteria bacterium]
MDKEKLIKEIRNYCKKNSDKKVVLKYSRYFKDGFDAYGLGREKFEYKLNSLLKEGKLNQRIIFDAAPELLKSGKFEETSYAILLLRGFTKEFNKKTFQKIETWFRYGINNWAHSDSLSLDIISALLLSKTIELKELSGWRKAKNKFQRRCSAVSLIKYIKAGKSQKNCLKFIEPLMKDTAREVQQGTGWFLRELWKINNTDTEEFLLKWKDTAPRLIFQYATEKMTASEKKKFKKE